MTIMNEFSLLAAFAHPDDESCLAGGTLAGCAAAGTQVTLICATRGEAAPPCCLPEPVTPPEMARIREAELHCAGAALGLTEVILWGLPDSGLAALDPVELTAKLLGYFRSLEPTVVMTFAPDDPLEEHPDHRAIGRAATAAAQAIGATLLYVAPHGVPQAGDVHLAVNIGPWADRKRRAMRCHRSQADCWHEREAALAWGEGAVEVYRLVGPPLLVALPR